MRALIISCLTLMTFHGAAFAQQPETVQPISTPAPWQVCNETSFIVRFAVATKTGDQMSARGWQRLVPGACLDIDAAENKSRFVYAESSGAYQGGIREWAGRVEFCAGDDNFDIKNEEECRSSGYETRKYLEVDADELVTRFVEPDNYSRRAQTAGLQRLLRENGYRVSRIDGVAGRRTARTLATFIKDKKLAANLTPLQKMDALENAAIDRIANLGIRVCNRSSSRVWAAVGHRLKNDWESRGWWSVEVGDCIQPMTTALIGSSAHIFARQEQPISEAGVDVPDKYLRSETAQPSQFCISGARFTARGREACGANGYEAVSFRPLPEDKDGVTVNVTDADFSTPSRAGLRR